MNLAIFDLDQTIIEGDSDHSWNSYISELGYQDFETHNKISQGFYNDYVNGKLIMEDYLAFNLKFFTEHSREEVLPILENYAQDKVQPLFRPKALAKIAEHRKMGHTILIITATNELVTKPIAKLLNIENLIATQVEVINGKWSGRGAGAPSFAEGKITRLQKWLNTYNKTIADCTTYFYSDSFNDRFLLDIVNFPIAVTPDDKLTDYANKKGWEILNWAIK